MRTMLVLLTLFVLSALPAAAQEAPTDEPLPAVIAPEIYGRAIDALNAEDFERALLDFSLFILLNPTYSRAYYGRAVIYLQAEDEDNALLDLERALATQPDSPELGAAIHATRAQIYVGRDQLDEALADYSESIALAPSIENLFSRALIYLNQQEFEQSLADLDAALELEAENPVLYVYHGLVNTLREDRQAAAGDYLRFIRLIETESVDGEKIDSGQILPAQLDRGVVISYPFEAREGQLLNAVAAPAVQGEQVDPLLVIVDEDGNPVIADDDSGRDNAALVLDFAIPADGGYTLIVSHSLGGFTGSIAVGIELRDAP
jgi:tetratricopeptide (TPR) repeat protein